MLNLESLPTCACTTRKLLRKLLEFVCGDLVDSECLICCVTVCQVGFIHGTAVSCADKVE